MLCSAYFSARECVNLASFLNLIQAFSHIFVIWTILSRKNFPRLQGGIFQVISIFVFKSPHLPRPGLRPPPLCIWREIFDRWTFSSSRHSGGERQRRPSVSRWLPPRVELYSQGRTTFRCRKRGRPDNAIALFFAPVAVPSSLGLSIGPHPPSSCYC